VIPFAGDTFRHVPRPVISGALLFRDALRRHRGESRDVTVVGSHSPNGWTEGTLRAHGFTVGLLAGLVRAGLVVAKRGA